MNTILKFFLVPLFGFVAVGCTIDPLDYDPDSESILSGNVYKSKSRSSREDALSILRMGNYLVLENNQYLLTIKESDALKLGITKFDFNEILSELENTNQSIKEMLQNPKIDLELMDPTEIKMQDINIGNNIMLLKTRSEPTTSGPSGTLSMSGQEQYSTEQFFLPRGYNGFYVYLRGAAITPIYTITVSFLSDYVHVKVGVFGTWSGTVQSYASNYYGCLKVQTTDSNGASGNYSAIKNAYGN